MRARHLHFIGMLFVIASVVLASCGGGGGGSSSSGGSVSVKGTSGNTVDLNGTWTAPCSYSATDQEDSKDTLVVNGGSFNMNTKIWSAVVTSNCTQTATPDMLINISGTVTSGATGTAIWMNGTSPASAPGSIPPNTKATQATVVFQSATITLQSDAYVAGANGNNICGGGWVKNVAKNVLGCPTVIGSTNFQDYWVIDDSTATLKWYSNDDDVAWHVDINSIMTK